MFKEDSIFTTGEVEYRPQAIYPGVNFVRADLGPLVEKAKTMLPEPQWQYFTNWARIVSDPKKAMGYLTLWIGASRKGLHNIYQMNYLSQIKDIRERHLAGAEELKYHGITVEMFFFGNSCKNESLEAIESIARQALPGTNFIRVNGESEFNGKKFKGENAEHLVWKAIEESVRDQKPIIILGVNMPSRSFSIWPIQHLHLCMDGGAEWAVAQKLARGLTRAPKGINKETFIIDWSFDPNRSSIDELLLSTAYDISRRENINIQTALKKVFNTFNIFELDEHDPYRWSEADYLRKILESNTIARVLGHSIIRDKWKELPLDVIAEMILCEVNQNKKLAKVFSGKNAQNKKKNNAQSISNQYTEDENLKKAIMGVLEEVIKRLPTIAQGCDAQTLDQMFEILSSRPDFASAIEKHLSPLKTSTLKKLFDLGILNPNIVDINLLSR